MKRTRWVGDAAVAIEFLYRYLDKWARETKGCRSATAPHCVGLFIPGGRRSTMGMKADSFDTSSILDTTNLHSSSWPLGDEYTTTSSSSNHTQRPARKGIQRRRRNLSSMRRRRSSRSGPRTRSSCGPRTRPTPSPLSRTSGRRRSPQSWPSSTTCRPLSGLGPRAECTSASAARGPTRSPARYGGWHERGGRVV